VKLGFERNYMMSGCWGLTAWSLDRRDEWVAEIVKSYKEHISIYNAREYVLYDDDIEQL
jgi:hypothetical protein